MNCIIETGGRDMTDIINFIVNDIGRGDYTFTMSIDDAIRNLDIIREAGYKIPDGMDAETFARVWNLLA